jgi:FMN-dependent NADH-azoreductase
MAKLLYLMASPRIERSHSLHIANAFVDAYRETHPQDQIETLNIFTADLPAFDGPILNAKYAIMHGHPHTSEEKKAWQAVEKIIADFKSADRYVFAIPMWNFGIPYRLKQYIDLIVQPGYTFNVDPQKGYVGLVTGKKAIIVYASGGEYGSPEARALDFQSPYIRTILRFIGITDFQELVMDGTLAPDHDAVIRKQNELTTQARQLAKDF